SKLKNIIKTPLLNFVRKANIYSSYFLIPRGNVSVDDLSSKSKVTPLSKPRKMINALPITIDKDIYWHFTKYIDVYEQRSFVIEADNWRVWGNQGAVITNDGYLLQDVSREFDSLEHTINKQLKLKPYVYINKRVAVLAASGNDNYYHWMFDIIPRINLLNLSGLLNRIEKFIINADGRRFQNEMLEKTGIDRSKIIVSNELFNFHIKVKELIVPSMPSYNGCPSNAACQYLRHLFQNEISTESNDDYIYLQRLDGRKIINEDAILTILKQHHFKIINPEKLSIAEQAKAFSKAKAVISAHGAGLTNIVFCKPETVIVELFSPQWIMPCYWILSNQIGLKYSYLIGENTSENNGGRTADILVNTDHFRQLLAKLELF
ncbi:MAG: capsular polysaccharide biosynthesis protein-like protein, partial [Mucilaginibacter sp.]|nr:capsular polysaccharide biosynthesis protein-like protein [Mucilaginibacter sp.]